MSNQVPRSKHLARFRVSRKLLAQVLNMPEGAFIYDVYLDRGTYLPDFNFLVEHEALRETHEGDLIYEVTPSLTENRTRAGELPPDEAITKTTWSWE